MTALEELEYLRDTSLAHIESQARCATDEIGNCQYRTSEGLGCAAAPFIREYNEWMEGKGWEILAVNFPASLDPIAVKHKDYVANLQGCHDVISGIHKREFVETFRWMVMKDCLEDWLPVQEESNDQ